MLSNWAKSQPRRSRVMPVYLRRPKKTASASEYIHAVYLSNRDVWLSKNALGRKANYYKPYKKFRWWAWFVQDILAQSILQVGVSWREVQETTGKGRVRQAYEVLKLSLLTPAKPENYYMFEWFEAEKASKAKEYLHRYELKNVIYKMLPTHNVSLSDKFLFESYARDNNISVPSTFLHIEAGKVSGKFDEINFDFFVKPNNGKGGRGAERYEFIGSSFRRASDGTEMALREIVHLYREKTRQCEHYSAYIFQKRIINHAALKSLSGEAVATCRVYTMINENGVPECVGAVFRMPGSMHGIVDNSHQGGLAAPIEIDSGRLGQGSYLGNDGRLGFYDSHPCSGGKIVDFQLPLWTETLETCLSAHERLRPRVIIGWDVSICDDGPVLIEANGQPCTDILQRRNRSPLGNARFGEIISFHLKERGL